MLEFLIAIFLYQVLLLALLFFKEEFPEENARFGNLIVTKAKQGDREKSLEVMRRRMLSENSFDAAVFAGGMGGIFDEYRLVTELAADAAILPIVSTGGAAAALGAEIKASSDLINELDYVALLFDKLSIDPNEPRG